MSAQLKIQIIHISFLLHTRTFELSSEKVFVPLCKISENCLNWMLPLAQRQEEILLMRPQNHSCSSLEVNFR